MKANSPKSSTRTVILRYFPLAAFVLLDIVFLAMLDSSFTYKKRAMILDTRDRFIELTEYINTIRDKLIDIRERYPKNEKGDNRFYRQANQYLEEAAPEILQGEHPWYRVVLANESGEIVYEYTVPQKLAEYNNWTNCLFSRTFSAPVGSTAFDLRLYYTTPKGWSNIEAMVLQYWLYALAFAAATTVLYFWLNRRVFKPLERVGSAIESTLHSHQVTVLSQPSHDIESAFNQMARNQREIRFGLKVDQIVDALHSLPDDQQVLEQFLQQVIQAIQDVYPFESILPFLYDSTHNQFQPLLNKHESPFPMLEKWIVIDKTKVTLVLHTGNQPVAALRCFGETRKALPLAEWEFMADEIRRQAESGLARSFTRSRALTEERNRFGINLATNMGHDLTNIIASSKWDLDTIQRAQGLGIIQLDEQKGVFFEDAVKGLNHNLEFLQEMVNIYRAVAYFRRPRYEKAELTSLLQQISELFRRSTSQNLSITVNAEQTVQMVIEPRLFRMGMFNILSNACQAIQKHDPRIPKGEITIDLQVHDQKFITLSIADNGPGIRDSEGNLLPDSEINRIFQSGYTTKGEGSGGGLGLTWVKSIVQEFHGGSMSAENPPQGGAKILVTLPIRTELPEESPSV